MSKDDYERTKGRLRGRLKKILADTEDLIADLEGVPSIRPEVAEAFVPDEWADVYAQRLWAQRALAALEADEPIPPPPQ